MKKRLTVLTVLACAAWASAALPDGVCAAENLLHRWSFASDATDAVGGTAGTLYGTATVSDGQLVLKGGNKNASYANLGKGLVPTNGAFTIEFWAKKTAVSSFGRICDIGTGTDDYIFFAWNRRTLTDTDQFGYRYANGKTTLAAEANDTMQYALNTFYHIAATYEPQADNSTRITLTRRNLKTGALERTGTLVSKVGWTPSLLTDQATFCLGHSQWNEPDSASVYEEIRVWNTALTADQLAWSGRLGPDVLPTTAMDDPLQTASLDATSDGEGLVRINGGAACSATNITEHLSAFATNTLTAVAKTGYRFKAWTGDTDLIVGGTTASETVQVLSVRTASLNATYQYAISTWTGLAGDGLWTTAGNWQDFTPNDGSEVVFGASDSTDTENNAIGSSSKITFLAEAPAYTIRGNALTLAALVNASAATQTLTCAVSSSAGLTLDTTGTVTFSEVFEGTGIAGAGRGTVRLEKGFAAGTGKSFVLSAQTAELAGASSGYAFLLHSGAHATVAPGSTLTFTGDSNRSIDVNCSGTGTSVLDLNDVTVETGHFLAGRTGTGTINMSGGTVTASSWLVAGINGTGTINLNAGTYTGLTKNEANPPFIVAENAGSKGTVNITGESRVTTAGSIDVGKRGTGTLNQSDGVFTVGLNLVLAREASGTGTYNLTGGEVSATNGIVFAGSAGTGTLNVSNTGVLRTNGVRFNGTGDKGASVVNVTDGGTIEATGFQGWYRYGRSRLAVDGGTIRVRGEKQSYTDFFDGIGEICVGTGGLTLDTGDNAVAFYEPIVTKTSTGTITKAGTGTLYLSGTSAANGGLAVAEGTVVATAPMPLLTTVGTAARTVPHLLHRWSFNDGSLKDDVTGASAVAAGTVSYTNGCLHLPGGVAGTGYVDLGADLLPTDGRPFTIEIFATPRSLQYWSRVFSFGERGNPTQNTTFVAWSRFATANTDNINFKVNNVSLCEWVDTNHYSLNKPYHIVLVCRPDVCGDNKMVIHRICEPVGSTSQFCDHKLGAFAASVADLKAERFWLGHSAWNSDNDANADYDEVRIWDVAFTPEQARRNMVLGADTLPNFNSGLVHRWSFNGTYEDSVGGQTATVGGTKADQVTWDDAENPRAVKLPGLGSNTGYISLGASAVPSSGDAATIELWVTKLGERGWGRIFELSSNSYSNYICMCHQNQGGRVEFKVDNVLEAQKDNTMTYPVGVRYHVAMTLVREADGRTTLKWSSRDDTGEVKGSGTTTTAHAMTLDPLFFLKSTLYLGHSGYLDWNDPDANATFDEVRIWRGALSDEQLVANAQLGPDALPETVDYVEVAGDASAVANLDLGTAGTFRWQSDLAVETVRGTGTLAGAGTLTVAKTLDVAGAETGALTLDGALAVTGTWTIDAEETGDRIVGTGSLDLSQATIEIRDASLMTADSYELVKGPALTGTVPKIDAPRYVLNKEANRLILVRRQLAIFIR